MEACIALVFLILVLWLITRKRHFSTFRSLGIPGPEPNLLFGNIIELYRKGPIHCHEEWINKYGRVLGYFYGMKPILLVADPKILKDVFIKDFQKFCNREPFNPIAAYSPHNKYTQTVTVLPAKRWKRVRSVLTPSFSAAKMKRMTSAMNSSIVTMVGILMEKAEKGSVIDVKETYSRMVLDTIAKTEFGLLTDVQTHGETRLYKATASISGLMYRDAFLLFGLCFPWLERCCYEAQNLFLGIQNEGSIPRETLRSTFTTAIEQRRQNPQKGICDILQLMIDSKSFSDSKVDVNGLEIGNAEYEEKTSKERKVNNVEGMSENEILSTSETLLVAGFGMISRALSFVTLLIAKHQQVQQKLYEEIRMSIPNEQEQHMDYDMINKLQYMDKVIDETLRLYPPIVLFSSRYAEEDVQYGDLKIPKGVIVQAPTYLLHRDSEFWEEPETFDPERFQDKMNSNGIVYLPFGVGPRVCLGMRFAKFKVKIALAHLLRNFKVTLADNEEKFELEFGMRNILLKNGCRVNMEPRRPSQE